MFGKTSSVKLALVLLATQLVSPVTAMPASTSSPASHIPKPTPTLGAAYAPCTLDSQCFSQHCEEGPCYSDLCHPSDFCSPVPPRGHCRTTADCDVNWQACSATTGRCKATDGNFCKVGSDCISKRCVRNICRVRHKQNEASST
ncbi:hypothetical protein OC835_007663 [Tilletia horrida]|nr:hypothetical protein OC835_007663 [Tilletia horrida]